MLLTPNNQYACDLVHRKLLERYTVPLTSDVQSMHERATPSNKLTYFEVCIQKRRVGIPAGRLSPSSVRRSSSLSTTLVGSSWRLRQRGGSASGASSGGGASDGGASSSVTPVRRRRGPAVPCPAASRPSSGVQRYPEGQAVCPANAPIFPDLKEIRFRGFREKSD